MVFFGVVVVTTATTYRNLDEGKFVKDPRPVEGPHAVVSGQLGYEIGSRTKQSRRSDSNALGIGPVSKSGAVFEPQYHRLVVVRIRIEVFDNLRPRRKLGELKISADAHVLESLCRFETFFPQFWIHFGLVICPGSNLASVSAPTLSSHTVVLKLIFRSSVVPKLTKIFLKIR